VPLYSEDIGLDDASIVFLIFGLLTLAIRLVGARLPDRLGPLRAGTCAGVGMTAGLTIMAVWGTVPGLITGTVVLAIGIAFLYPGVMTLALTGVPENQRASVVGAVSMCFDLAGAFGALILGVVASFAGFRGAFAGGAVFAIAGLVLLRSGIDPRTRPGAPTDHEAAELAQQYLEPDPP
jgi:MFS family permease